jgi:hypothetical protein
VKFVSGHKWKPHLCVTCQQPRSRHRS